MSQASYKLKNAIKISGLNNNSPIKLNLYESNIEPMLRFLHLHNLKPFGWFEISKYDLIEDNDNTDIYQLFDFNYEESNRYATFTVGGTGASDIYKCPDPQGYGYATYLLCLLSPLFFLLCSLFFVL